MKLLRAIRRRLRLRSLDPADYSVDGEQPERRVDAEAAAGTPNAPGYPPGYVKDYDDGRPRH
jgi:hypothetical protein